MNSNNTMQWERWRENRKTEYNSREIAYQYIRKKIINLEYSPGRPLSDKVLAEELEMSRTPIREALLLLNAKNMVVVKPQSGTYVAPINTYWIEIEQFKRFSVEKEVITLAFSKITDDIRRQYEENIASYEESAATAEDSEKHLLLNLDNAFHSIAFTAAGKEDHFFNLMEDMQHIERFRSLSLHRQRMPEVNREHREIAEAISEGRQIDALYHLEKHLYAYRDQMDQMKKEYPEYFTIG